MSHSASTYTPSLRTSVSVTTTTTWRRRQKPFVAVALRVSSMSVMTSLTKKSRRVTSLPTSRRRQKRRTPSGRTCTSTLRGSLKESAPSERSPLTSVSSSWSICRQRHRYTALKRSCTPILLQVIGQPTPNRVQSNSFELPRCEGGRVKLNLPCRTSHCLS